MQVVCLLGAVMVFLSSCAPAAAVDLSAGQKAAIGKKIWQNECAGSVAGLTTWNAGEEFPSIGIGHFIWYPAGFKGRFEESWPELAKFARQRGAELPAVAFEAHSPWRTKGEFQADFKGPRLAALRGWLAAHVAMQTDFIIVRSQAALPKILAAAPASERARIEANYRRVSTTSQGTYALIDYVNFKGEGVQASEKYKGAGWGLMQVLGGMKETPGGAAAATEFAASAKRILSRRIANSPPERGEKRWEQGWHSRCMTYARPL